MTTQVTEVKKAKKALKVLKVLKVLRMKKSWKSRKIQFRKLRITTFGNQTKTFGINQVCRSKLNKLRQRSKLKSKMPHKVSKKNQKL